MGEILLETHIIHDDYTAQASRFFDVPIEDKSRTVIKNNLVFDTEWQIGLVYGPSGSGKTTILKHLGNLEDNIWDNNKSIISNFYPISFDIASHALCSVGFSSIPAWYRPYNCLSNGEKFRADLARTLTSDKQIYLIDEFTSVVDRTVAKSASHAVSKWIRKDPNKKVIFASCHEDIIEWLQPDWVYNPLEGTTVYPRGCLQRPPIDLQIFRCKYDAWELFKQHHYLSQTLNKAAKCFMVMWNDRPVAFNATLAFPNPYVKNGWRGSRTVVLPDYQGLGIGSWLSDHIGSMIAAGGGRYFSKTTHPAMIAYRLKSNKWKETTHSRKARATGNKSMMARNWSTTERFCYAFEYIGAPSSQDEAKIFWEKC